jgi:hypothetical protein
MKLTRRQKQVLAALKRGCRLWRYSTQNTAYLYVSPNNYETVRIRVLNALEEAGLIEEDESQSFYRSDSGSDLVYKLVTKEAA